MNETSRAALKVFQDTAKQIRALEAEAAKAAEIGDKPAHRAHLTAKCLLLMDLPDKLKEEAPGLKDPEAKQFVAAAQGFARRAGQALDVDSVFYMYALLYPDDYQEGGLNDIERFVQDYQDAAS